MANQIAQDFLAGCEAIRHSLLHVPEDIAGVPWRAGGWTRRQVLGHMIDSAANNHQRFVRAALDGSYTGPFYAQEGWVIAHGYNEMPWLTLLAWWQMYHEILKVVVERIPAEKLDAECHVGDDKPVTLQFLIEDYIAHQKHHLAQILCLS
ncbi:MAG TPA: DinB family protein [Alloacidobacterium sp.]|nr:DinB family protein [Alloacidobacterium sp.]